MTLSAERFRRRKSIEPSLSEVRSWWDENPYEYDSETADPATADWIYFRNIDRRFLKRHSPWAQIGFPMLGGLVPYAELSGKQVLDVGCGTGWAAEQFAGTGARVTAFDLAPRHARLTRRRLELANQHGLALEGDALQMPFADGSFEFALAWGTIMHWPDPQKGVGELHRVLKPGGRAGAMLYHRNSVHWKWQLMFLHGVLLGWFLRMSPAEVARRLTNAPEVGGSPVARAYNRSEIQDMFEEFSEVRIRVFDLAETMGFLPSKRLPIFRYLIPGRLKDWLTRRVGWYLWVDVVK